MKKRLIAAMSDTESEIINLLFTPSDKLEKMIFNYCKYTYKDYNIYQDTIDEEKMIIKDLLNHDAEFLFDVIETLMEDYQKEQDVTFSNEELNTISSDLLNSDSFLSSLTDVVDETCNDYGYFDVDYEDY